MKPIALVAARAPIAIDVIRFHFVSFVFWAGDAPVARRSTSMERTAETNNLTRMGAN
jgi:hypothetical protein